MKEEQQSKRTTSRIVVASSALFILAVLATGYALFGINDVVKEDSNNDALAENQTVSEVSASDTPDSSWNMTGNVENGKIFTSKDKKTDSPILISETIEETAVESPPTDTPEAEDIPDTPADPQEETDFSYIIGDFNDGLDGWGGDVNLGSDQSSLVLEVSNNADDTADARKIFETPILKGFSFLEFDIRSVNSGMEYRPLFINYGDAIIGFGQNGGWKQVSLADYADATGTGWQHIQIPLADFAGLNANEKVVDLNFRLWASEPGYFYLDNIALTGNKTEISTPTDLVGSIVSSEQIDLSWSGESAKYNVYENDQKVATTETNSYSGSYFKPDNTYTFYVTALDEEGNESLPSAIITLSTPSLPDTKAYVSDFENGDLDGWISENASLTSGYNSDHAIRLLSLENSIGMEKIIDYAIANNHQNIEFDINVNGSYFDPGNAELIFDQNGWNNLPLNSYFDNGITGWQHIIIPLSDFNINREEGIARIIFRFWNADPVTIDIDNIVLN